METDNISSGNAGDYSRGNSIVCFRGLVGELLEWDKLNNVEFAMWFPSAEDAVFTLSPVIEEWKEIYSLTRYYWSYITADFLKTLNLLEGDSMRIFLPDGFNAFAFTTPDNEQVILSLSQEKGLRIHFAEATSLGYRLGFLKSFKLYCKAWKELIEINNGIQDDDLGFADWWELALKTAEAIQLKEPLESFGKIVK
ncbi:hypothetical protein D0T84_03830 [Dysgonomonas sp. 521]|uniref:hypothetical protein n=1 Tax=Dysgonomonas sp. 521 TaxID=2302932 RepID=UPI0013CFE7C1|nr:hypothetical protein [Dysgonomonas sp. 521]NDV94048.1 hypothetical protein [Dysgonomonas sp. 521]